MLIHNYLFYELGVKGFPVQYEGYKIKYYYLDHEADLIGFDEQTELKIKVMRELWRKIKENKMKNL